MRRTPVLALAALTVAGLLSSPATLAAGPDTGPDTGSGGDARPARLSWSTQTVYDDDFSGTRLNGGWSRYDSAYGSGPKNYARPDHFALNGKGKLVLTMKYRRSGKDGAAWYTGGAMLDERYGSRFQAIDLRYKVVSRGVQSHRNIPMLWVDDPDYEWYEGETNFNEGTSLHSVTTFLHHGPDDQDAKTYRVDMTKWHRWRFEHTPDRRIRVFLDGKLVWDHQGDATTVPDAFRRVVLQQEVSSGRYPKSTKGSERIMVDYLRVQTFTPQ